MATWDEEDDTESMEATATVELDDEAPVVDEDEIAFDEDVVTLDEPLVYDDQDTNLVEVFSNHPEGQKFLKEAKARVKLDFDNDWESTRGYRERMAGDFKIFAGDLPPKEFPFKDAANPHVPIMLENISRLALRAFGELFGDWTNVFGVQPLGPDDDKLAEILTLHGNWQISEQIPDFKRQMKALVQAFFCIGDVTVHSEWDDERRCNKHELLTPDDFVVPYTHKSTMPDWSDVPHRTRIKHMYRHQLQRKRGAWFEVDELLEKGKPSWDSEPEQPLARSTAEVSGQEIPDSEDGDTPYKVLYYEGWFDLPGKDEARFCQVIMEYESEHILALRIYERENWQDRERYDMQLAERDAYLAAAEAYQAELQKREQELMGAANIVGNLVSQGAMGPQQAAAAQQALEAESMAPLPPGPTPPEWMQDPGNYEEEPEPPRMEPISMYAHAVCIEPLTGNLGLSYGRIEADFNRAANTALAQFTDAATMANCYSIILADGVDFKEPFEIGPGKVHRATGVSAAELANGVQPLKVQPANPQLIELVDKMVGYGQSAIQAPSAMSGEPGKSGETYRGFAARLEQATKQLSVAAGAVRDMVTLILKNNAYLNSIFLRDEEVNMVADHIFGTGEMREVKLSREIYRRSYNVVIRADLRFASQAQKISEADEIVQTAMKIPMLAQNPEFMFYALKKAFIARGRADLVQYMKPPPPPMQPGQPPQGPPPAPGGPPAPPGPPRMPAPPQGPPQGPPGVPTGNA